MLELCDVCAGYGKQEVLHAVSLSFLRGRVTAVIGPNGSGKSTLLQAAAGLLPIRGGGVSVDGDLLSSLSRNEIAKRISYLPQGRRVPDMTAMQLVLHGRFPHLHYPRRYSERDRQIAREALSAVGLLHEADRSLTELSGGMRQCAYLAMALAQESDYILLDEPTTYLDIPHQLELLRLLRRLAAEGKGIVCVMHDLSLALTFSDAVAVLENGNLLVLDEPHTVAKSGIPERVFDVSVYPSQDNGYAVSYHIDK